MTATASSKLMRFWTPERAIWALTKATEAAGGVALLAGHFHKAAHRVAYQAEQRHHTFAPAAARAGQPAGKRDGRRSRQGGRASHLGWQPPSAPDTLALRAMR